MHNMENFQNKIKQHEDNIKLLSWEANSLDESILDLKESIARYQSDDASEVEKRSDASLAEMKTIEQIFLKEKSAAGIFCWVKAHHLALVSNSAFMKDVVGVVATLARVNDDSLSRILSEYLGLETMLAIVCRTLEGAKALERYDGNNMIDCNVGLHELGSSIGRKISGRFQIICLENSRPYFGSFVANDPQRKLDIPKPKLRSGDCPQGFIDYAVNMISVDTQNISCVTASGHGLRETLFYNLFSYLQIYRTRSEMLLALPCISDGALSLDGGMIKKSGIFALGSRNDVEVKFPVISGERDIPASYIQSEDTLRTLKWKRSIVDADLQREQQLLDQLKASFSRQA